MPLGEQHGQHKSCGSRQLGWDNHEARLGILFLYYFAVMAGKLCELSEPQFPHL